MPTIQIATFRGHAFEVLDVSRSGGRRITTTEYPQRDIPFSQDLGRTARRYRFRFFIAEPDLAGKKSRLIAALESEGPGLLNHPTEGPLTVRVESYDITESTGMLDTVEFSASFVEDGPTAPAATPATATAATFGDNLRTAVKEAYAARREVLTVTDRVRRVLTGDLEDQCVAALGLIGQFTGTDTSAYSDAVRAVSDGASTLWDDAEGEVDAWTGVFQAIPESADQRTAAESFTDAVAVAVSYAAQANLSDQEQATRDALVDGAVARALSALSVATESSVDEDWTAADDAIAAASLLSDLCDAIEPYALDSETLAALADIRTSAAQGILDEAASLPQLRTLDVPSSRTTWDLALALYGDGTRADEILERNGIADPIRVMGAIRVLTE